LTQVECPRASRRGGKNDTVAGMRTRLFVLARFFAAVLFAALVLAAPAVARAAGTVTVTDTQPKEDDGRWKLKMSINYGNTPPTAHIPMLFTFTLTTLYERTLTDKSPNTPVLTKLPMQNQQPINESMDVGFSDASGKLFNITKFDFVIRRDHGFEAGEYSLKITRSSDGSQMGQVIRLTLQGDNTVVDRRAIVFTGEKKDKKKDNPDASQEKKDKPDDSAAANTPSESPDPSAQTDTPVETPPAAPPKSGCGCRVAELDDSGGAALLALLGLAAYRYRRRRR
jgi:MYXO-CTERM domain-containing protein